MSEHDDIHLKAAEQLLVPYALGLLDDDERARVERALDADAGLRSELDAVNMVGARMLSELPAHPAPSHVKASVLDAIASPDPSPAPAPVTNPIRSVERSVVRPVRRRWMPQLVAAVATAASIAFAFVALDARQDLRSVERDLREARSTAVPQPLRAAASQRISTSAALSTAHGHVLKTGDSLILVLEDVPDPGDGASWQVWAEHQGGDVVNAAQWTRAGTVRIAVIDDAGDVTGVMVSHEHARTPVLKPSSEPMALVRT